MRENRPDGWWALNRPWELGTPTVVGLAFAWMITSNLVLTDAIYVPCTVLALEGWAPGVFNKPEGGSSVPKFLLRVGLALFRTLIATEVTQFLALTRLTSSMFCICNNIL